MEQGETNEFRNGLPANVDRHAGAEKDTEECDGALKAASGYYLPVRGAKFASGAPGLSGIVKRSRAACHEAMRLCAQTGISEADCASLDLALGEALANAVVHGVPAALLPRAMSVSVCGIIGITPDRPGLQPDTALRPAPAAL